MRFGKPEYLRIKFGNTLFLFINKVKTDFQLCCLFRTDCTINSCLYLLDRMLTAFINKRCDIKGLAGMFKYLLDDGT